MTKSLAIVGAGAKAAAIVARAAVLKDHWLKGSPPDIEVFETRRIGAAWDGQAGNTGQSSGHLTLCSPGEKDVGFPYAEIETRKRFSAPPAVELFSRFSFHAFQVARGRFSQWVDRGRDNPSHETWAAYLNWVFAQANVSPTIATVTAVTPLSSGRWRVDYDEAGRSRRKEFDGVVLTGTGHASAVPCDLDVPEDRIFDSDSFWANRRQLLGLKSGTIAVAGGGGAAGAVVAWLVNRFAETDVRILSINPAGTLFARGDGYAERRWFSDPFEWKKLAVKHRQKILSHTEVGVVSLRNKSVIDQSEMVDYRPGSASIARFQGDVLTVDIAYEGEDPEPEAIDYLISAIGFDRWSLLDLVEHHATANLCAPDHGHLRDLVLEGMLDDLSLPPVSGLPAGLHVPALAELSHGPGMSNLGCLGLLAKAILEAYP